MNLKKIFALTVASATFAMAQTAAPATNVIASDAKQPQAESPAAPATDVIATLEGGTQSPAESSAPATNVIASETKQPQAESPAATATNVIASETKQSPAEPERKGPPKTPFTVLHGSVYNSVGNEAAADNVDILLNKRLTKFYGQKFFYIEPNEERGVISLGSFFGAMDISGDLGRATAGYTNGDFALEGRLSLGQFAIDGDDGKKSGSNAGDDWGVTLSKMLGGYVVTTSFDWITTDDQVNLEPKVGKSVEQRFRDMTGSLILTNGPSARKHFMSGGIVVTRHENEVEVGGHIVNEDVDSRITFVPMFNYGTPVLRSERANVFLGMNAAVPVSRYADQEMMDSTKKKPVETSLFVAGLSLTPNVLAEALVHKSVMLFGEASYEWNAFQYVSGTDATGDEYTVKESVADIVNARIGLRYQYEDWIACEFAFGDSFFTDTKSIFNGEGIFVKFGGFLYF
jgi:hypothetical protein